MCYKIKNLINVLLTKIKFKRMSSSIGKIISSNNPQYICVGKRVRIKAYCRIDCYKSFGGGEYNPALIIEDGVIIGHNFTCLVADYCSIGKDTILAHNVSIISENHGIDVENNIPFHEQRLKTGSCIIGSNCWIGCNVVFLPNSAIGNNCIVAANSVVNKKFPDNCMIGGTPAHILKTYDFEQHKWIKVYETKIKDKKDIE